MELSFLVSFAELKNIFFCKCGVSANYDGQCTAVSYSFIIIIIIIM